MLDRGDAGRLVVAVVLMHAERDVGIHLRQRVDHLRQHDVVGVGARAARGLDDHRRVDRGRRLHDREPLLHVVDVEGRHAVAVLGGVVEQLPQRDTRHRCLLSDSLHGTADGHRRPRSREQSRVRRGDHRLGGDAELAVQHLGRRRGAEAGHADEVAAVAEPARPVAVDRRLDADARSACPARRRDSRRGCSREQLEAGRRDDGGADAVARPAARPRRARSTLPSRWRSA